MCTDLQDDAGSTQRLPPATVFFGNQDGQQSIALHVLYKLGGVSTLAVRSLLQLSPVLTWVLPAQTAGACMSEYRPSLGQNARMPFCRAAARVSMSASYLHRDCTDSRIA